MHSRTWTLACPYLVGIAFFLVATLAPTVCNLRMCHRKQEFGSIFGRTLILDLIFKHCLQQHLTNQEFVAFSLLSEAIAVKERAHMPLVGASLDRRALQCVGGVCNADKLNVLMCFVCGCKHMQYTGLDMFGNPMTKGKISFRTDAQFLKKIFTESNKEQPHAAVSYALFQKLYGKAVSTDPFLQENSAEWLRRVYRSGEELLCCPEDMQLSSKCKHSVNEICLCCKVPICHECAGHIKLGEQPSKALTNDNFISYAHEYIVQQKVTWLEATIACPIFTGLITYYLEDISDGGSQASASRKGNRHLMDNPLAKPQGSVSVRGNAFVCAGCL